MKMRGRALACHGILTSADLTGLCGLSRSAIDRRVRHGELVRLHRGIFRLGAHPPTWEGDVLAAQLAGGPGAFSSHRTAATVYGLDGVIERVVDVSIYTTRKVAGAVVHRLTQEDRPRVRIVDELRIACVERTLLDLAAVLPPRSTGDAMDDAIRRRLTTLERMKSIVVAQGGRGRKGSAALRSLVADRDGADERVRTKFEAKMLRVIRGIRCPAVPDFRLRIGGQTRYLDFAFPAYHVGVECHSARWHKGHRAWLRDIERDRQLVNQGWLILYFAWAEVIEDSRKVARDIEEALRRRGALL